MFTTFYNLDEMGFCSKGLIILILGGNGGFISQNTYQKAHPDEVTSLHCKLLTKFAFFLGSWAYLQRKLQLISTFICEICFEDKVVLVNRADVTCVIYFISYVYLFKKSNSKQACEHQITTSIVEFL